LIGTFQHTIDAKGRLFIPARLRDELGEKFYVTISGEECLLIYSLDRWESALDKLKAMPLEDQMELRQVFASASKCELDGQGRIQLTQDLREHAELVKNVTIVGTGLYVQIWDSEKYKVVQDKERKRENIKVAMRKLNF